MKHTGNSQASFNHCSNGRQHLALPPADLSISKRTAHKRELGKGAEGLNDSSFMLNICPDHHVYSISVEFYVSNHHSLLF